MEDNRLKITLLLLLPFYQFGNIWGWIILAKSFKDIISVSVVACIFLAAVGFYSVVSINRILSKKS